ncbi:CLUMA_CG006308, isoform A [Clunio marinus]|uniref:CLUMA_CG006308, isoform A n=1 Tax=Clunio marinus TaxID=568069 RepID=A0A1J1I228_9DIPT|nr:CLUMA_CG006308, isoform A [Clunio marinus]
MELGHDVTTVNQKDTKDEETSEDNQNSTSSDNLTNREVSVRENTEVKTENVENIDGNTNEDKKEISKYETMAKDMIVEKKVKCDSHHLPTFPGTITKSVPGSNDVKIEIDSDSLLDRVILFSLKNTVVDNSRLDAAKNKYLVKDSKPSLSADHKLSLNHIVKKFDDDDCDVVNIQGTSSTSTIRKESDNYGGFSNGAENESNVNNEKNNVDQNQQVIVMKSLLNTPKTLEISLTCGEESSNKPSLAQCDDDDCSDESKRMFNIETDKSRLDIIHSKVSCASSTDNNNQSNKNFSRSSPIMLDLTISHRKTNSSTPFIKQQNNSLYVGLPDFTKKIYSAPLITYPTHTTTINSKDVKNLSSNNNNLSKTENRNSPLLLAYNWDQSHHHHQQQQSSSYVKCSITENGNIETSKTSDTSSSTSSASPLNFNEILKKNNYIKDLQLKPPLLPPPRLKAYSPTPSSVYKVDYHMSDIFSQKIREGFAESEQNNYMSERKNETQQQQQIFIDEPMAHIIHKSHFQSHQIPENFNRTMKQKSESTEVIHLNNLNCTYAPEAEIKLTVSTPHHFQSSLIKEQHEAQQTSQLPQIMSAISPDFNKKFHNEQPISHEFSLEQKEEQLRQEGTILTVTNEMNLNRYPPTKEFMEQRSAANFFRDSKMMKQMKASPTVGDYNRMNREQSSATTTNLSSSYAPGTHVGNEINININVNPTASTIMHEQDRQMKHEISICQRDNSILSSTSIPYYHRPPSLKGQLKDHGNSSVIHVPQNWPPSQQYPEQIMLNKLSSRNSNVKPGCRLYLTSESSSNNSDVGQHQQVFNVGHHMNRHYQDDRKNQNNYYQTFPSDNFSRHHFDTELENKRPERDVNSDFYYQSHHHVNRSRIVENFRSCSPPPPPPPVAPYSDDGRHLDEHHQQRPPQIQTRSPLSASASKQTEIVPLLTERKETKREFPLDLSMRTIKTKADSTGCDKNSVIARHHQQQHQSESTVLKIDFTPNFADVEKRDSCQQQELFIQQHPAGNKTNRDRYYPKKSTYERNYHPAQHQHLNSFNYNNKNSSPRPVSVINKAISQYHKIPSEHFPSRSANHHLTENAAQSRNPLYYERERDRLYVQQILKRNSRKEDQQHQQPSPLPPPQIYRSHLDMQSLPRMMTSDDKFNNRPLTKEDEIQNPFPYNYRTQQPPTPPQTDHPQNHRNFKEIPSAIMKQQLLVEQIDNSYQCPQPMRTDAAMLPLEKCYKPTTTISQSQNNKTLGIDESNVIKSNVLNSDTLPLSIHHQMKENDISENVGFREESINKIVSSSCVNNLGRGADHNTILKLKTNLELKEQKKLSGQMNEKKPNDDLSPRLFRTKGELKGFITTNHQKQPLETSKNEISAISSSPATSQTLPSDIDLNDWENACSKFVQQLKVVDVVKKEKTILTKSKAESGTTGNEKKIDEESKDETSSDEDKPLFVLLNTQCGSIVNKNDNHETLKEDNAAHRIKNMKNIREKKRLEIEQKLANRLGDSSSSESEIEVGQRSAPITKKMRRFRRRTTLVDNKCKGNDEVNEKALEKEETEEEKSQKGRFASSRKYVKKNKKTPCSEHDIEKKSTDDKVNLISTKKQESSDDINASSKGVKKTMKNLKHLSNNSLYKTLLEEEETMTRSKRKLEIEKKLSNSKILRNEKIVQNIAPDKKAKLEIPLTSAMKKRDLQKKDSETTKRKVPDADSDTNNKSNKKFKRQLKMNNLSSSEESTPTTIEMKKIERLRPRKNLSTDNQCTEKERTKNKMEQKKPSDVMSSSFMSSPVHPNPKSSTTKASLKDSIFLPPFIEENKKSKFTPGWEVEAYNYKRSLKIPAGLISIVRPPQHGISHSLPDLDQQSSDTSDLFSEFLKSNKKEESNPTSPVSSLNFTEDENKHFDKKKSNSIIELLHQRFTHSSKQKPTTIKKATNTPTPSKNDFDCDFLSLKKKKQRAEFSTCKKDILKEIFGVCDDERPKSAPPVSLAYCLDDETVEKSKPDEIVTFDEKYREYLEKLNFNILSESEIKRENENRKKISDTLLSSKSLNENKETTIIDQQDLTISSFRGKIKKGKTRRCKMSSGFDYIRKKKKPSQNINENTMNINNIIKKRLEAMKNLENKDESDISKEIKGWVLNKGVGESVLHKASRLDYVDVIAFCLDRMNMNPDPKDNAGYTPLHEACSRGHLDVARILLQYGANHSETALSGIRPLHEAIENGHIEIVRLLISYGADPCLATYSGQLPISLADDERMEVFLEQYLIDINERNGKLISWFFSGSYEIETSSEHGFMVLSDLPTECTDLESSSVFSISMTSLVTAPSTQFSDNEVCKKEISSSSIGVDSASSLLIKTPIQDNAVTYQQQHKKMKDCDANSNNLLLSDVTDNKDTKPCSVVLNNVDSNMKSFKKLSMVKLVHENDKRNSDKKGKNFFDIDDITTSENEYLELEESEAPLPPLYLLRGEGPEKWILLNDLCNLLKVKSKDAALKQICPLSPSTVYKGLIRELKMSDFLEKATCLQLFCAGEKINVRASKVSLVRYNDNVRNLLGVQTIRMNM